MSWGCSIEREAGVRSLVFCLGGAHCSTVASAIALMEHDWQLTLMMASPSNIYLRYICRFLPNSNVTFSQWFAQPSLLPSRNLCSYFFGASLPLAKAVLPGSGQAEQPAGKTNRTRFVVSLFTGPGEITWPWAGRTSGLWEVLLFN